MPATQKPMRYGHTEGHTDVCFDDSGSCIVTCGSDGDVRIWEDLDDDDPKSINVGEKAYSCALKVQVKLEDHKVITACLLVEHPNQLTAERAPGPVSETQSSVRHSEEEVDVVGDSSASKEQCNGNPRT